MLIIKPISIREAKRYVELYHRHHHASVGGKFAISVWDKQLIHGVAIAGRPVSRYLDDGLTLEINRVCTDGTKNACSKLYSACVRIAKEMGYKKVITYILEDENGASVKASNFKYDGVAGGKKWTGIRNTISLFPEYKQNEKLKKRFVCNI